MFMLMQHWRQHRIIDQVAGMAMTVLGLVTGGWMTGTVTDYWSQIGWLALYCTMILYCQTSVFSWLVSIFEYVRRCHWSKPLFPFFWQYLLYGYHWVVKLCLTIQFYNLYLKTGMIIQNVYIASKHVRIILKNAIFVRSTRPRFECDSTWNNDMELKSISNI